MNKVDIYLIRHGETVSRENLPYPEASAVALSPLGKHQAKVVGRRIKHLLPATVVSSPFPRAFDTARFALPKASIETDERLSEYTPTTSHTGQEFKEWKKKVMDDFVFIPPSGESMEMAGMRVRNVLADAISKGEGTVIIFGHALSFGAFLKREFQLNHFPVLEECSITHLTYNTETKEFSIKKLNSRTWDVRIFFDRLWRKFRVVHQRLF
ncbi:MAG: histidine phosphatase family protein [Candidatus Paceibacterota bacterium]